MIARRSRVSALMKPARRNRTAVQSSSIAIIRTGSKPASPSGAQLLELMPSSLV